MSAITLPAAAKTNTKAGWRDLLEGVSAQIEATGRECDRTGAFVSKTLDLLEGLGFQADNPGAKIVGSIHFEEYW